MAKSKYTPRPRNAPVTESAPQNGCGERPAWMRWLPGVLIVVIVFGVYANSLIGPFIFDDIESITRNESIRNVWSFDVLSPHGVNGQTVGGRPLLNLSFAINYAISGLDVWSYHVANVVIHALAALVLFGLVRRTVRNCGLRLEKCEITAAGATLFAVAVALVWAVHPLLTGSVSYVVQRAESLCGLFYLLAVWCFIRGVYGKIEATAPVALIEVPQIKRREAVASTLWLTLSVLACFAGVATKEVAVTIPLIVLLYDRTFIAGSFSTAWRLRRGFYAALSASWVLLALLMTSFGGRGMSAGFASGMRWWEYALTQCWAVVHYLRLAVWPSGQIFDYGILLINRASDVLPQLLFLAGLLGAAAWALWRKPIWGFLGAWFFLILAPTSSIVPVVTQTVAEHRMYLPLIAIVAGVLAISINIFGPRIKIFGVCIVLLVGVLGAATVVRNRIYQSEESVWRDVTEKHPANVRAWSNLGVALQMARRNSEAAECYLRAIALQPRHAFAQGNLGSLLLTEKRAEEAVPHLRVAVELEPGNAIMREDLGTALAAVGKTHAMAQRFMEAERYLREAVIIQPDNAEGHGNLGNVLLLQERVAEAVREYEIVLRLKPADASARANLELAREMLR